MRHTDILKQAFRITWRYRPLWLFGFLLALCGGGSGGGGGGNFNFSSGGGEGDFGNLPNIPEIDPNLVIAVVVGFICLILLLAVVGVVVQQVTRTALIGMVRQIKDTEAVTVRDGWRFGWSNRAWRIFLLSLLIGIPATILTIGLILLALSPLLLLFLDNTASTVLSIMLTVFACIFVFILLIIVGVILAPIQELAWRRIALDQRGVIDGLREAVTLIRQRLKDVAIIWLLMFGVGLVWGIGSLIVVLPVSLIAAALLGGIPAGLVYLISQSGWGAAIAGVPLALLALIVVSSAANGLYLIYQSAVWTLAYLELEKPVASNQTPDDLPDTQTLTPDPL
ncbi:MAG: hypothetical protein HS126_10945 [Anaerolineales bacterium]|nr:hypothetical protein [Anaerolineales bacterium]